MTDSTQSIAEAVQAALRTATMSAEARLQSLKDIFCGVILVGIVSLVAGVLYRYGMLENIGSKLASAAKYFKPDSTVITKSAQNLRQS